MTLMLDDKDTFGKGNTIAAFREAMSWNVAYWGNPPWNLWWCLRLLLDSSADEFDKELFDLGLLPRESLKGEAT